MSWSLKDAIKQTKKIEVGDLVRLNGNSSNPKIPVDLVGNVYRIKSKKSETVTLGMLNNKAGVKYDESKKIYYYLENMFDSKQSFGYKVYEENLIMFEKNPDNLKKLQK